MKIVLICVCALFVLFLLVFTICALILGGEADERDRKMFEEWVKTRGEQQERTRKNDGQRVSTARDDDREQRLDPIGFVGERVNGSERRGG